MRHHEAGLYHVNEVFGSVQGEGLHAGLAHLFVRFAGCNLACSKDSPQGFDCDSEFTSGRELSLAELLHEVAEERQRLGGRIEWVCLTGGEPALQVDRRLLDGLHALGFSVAIETNGTVALVDEAGEALPIDWITVSPKTAEHSIRQTRAHEAKYVRAYGQGLPKTQILAEHYLISPAFDGPELDPRAVHWCLGLITENPSWRLSLQTHKWIGVR